MGAWYMKDEKNILASNSVHAVKLLRRSVLIIGTILGASIVYLYFQCSPLTFDSTLWKSDHPSMTEHDTQRQRMIRDLMMILDSTRPSKEAVLELLGGPTRIEKESDGLPVPV